jgi:cytochrome oxidase assembly protein ShyY1
MDETLSLAQRLATISGPVLMALILITSYLGVWVWGRQLREVEARCAATEAKADARVVEAKAETREWNDMALRSVGISETSVDQLARRPSR